MYGILNIGNKYSDFNILKGNPLKKKNASFQIELIDRNGRIYDLEAASSILILFSRWSFSIIIILCTHLWF